MYPGADRTGFYAGLSTGQLYFTGRDRSNNKNAWVVGLKAGYDILQYLGIEAIAKFSAHETSLKTPSTTVPYGYNAYQLIGQLKGAVPLSRRFYFNLGAGGGLFYSDPNLNSSSGGASRGMVYGEAGFEYFMRTRGISIGIDPSMAAVKSLSSVIIQATGFVRYTF